MSGLIRMCSSAKGSRSARGEMLTIWLPLRTTHHLLFQFFHTPQLCLTCESYSTNLVRFSFFKEIGCSLPFLFGRICGYDVVSFASMPAPTVGFYSHQRIRIGRKSLENKIVHIFDAVLDQQLDCGVLVP